MLLIVSLSFINIMSKLATSPISQIPPKSADPTSPGLPPTTKGNNGAVPPALSTNALSAPGSLDISTLGISEPQLRRQSLECLVAVLKSLVAWGTTSTNTVETPGEKEQIRTHSGEDVRSDNVTPDHSIDRLSVAPSLSESSRLPTPEQINDDPTKFENAKQKKTTLLEGIKKFNFKPKRVCLHGTRCVVSHSIRAGHQFFHRNWLYSKLDPSRNCAIPS